MTRAHHKLPLSQLATSIFPTYISSSRSCSTLLIYIVHIVSSSPPQQIFIERQVLSTPTLPRLSAARPPPLRVYASRSLSRNTAFFLTRSLNSSTAVHLTPRYSSLTKTGLPADCKSALRSPARIRLDLSYRPSILPLQFLNPLDATIINPHQKGASLRAPKLSLPSASLNHNPSPYPRASTKAQQSTLLKTSNSVKRQAFLPNP